MPPSSAPTPSSSSRAQRRRGAPRLETLTWLESNGYAELVRGAVVVLNTARPGAPLVRADELEAHFRSRVRQVVRVPYDPHIASGSAIAFRDLQPETREAARGWPRSSSKACARRLPPDGRPPIRLFGDPVLRAVSAPST
jgi:hypothetical protein